MKNRKARKPVSRFTYLPIVLMIYSVSFAQHPGWTVYDTTNSGLPKNDINAIAIDAGGNKWIGTNGGLAKFDGAHWTIYSSSNSGLPNNFITSIVIDENGNKWIGTILGGLAVFSGGNTAVTMKHGTALNPLSPICGNYPNPFKQKTLISYNVLENGPVSLRIYSLDRRQAFSSNVG